MILLKYHFIQKCRQESHYFLGMSPFHPFANAESESVNIKPESTKHTEYRFAAAKAFIVLKKAMTNARQQITNEYGGQQQPIVG